VKGELDVRVQFVNVDVFAAKMKLNITFILKDSNPITGFGQVMVKQFHRPLRRVILILVLCIKVLQAVVHQ
jgi:hypothetical protein